jgi:hypothetical protein
VGVQRCQFEVVWQLLLPLPAVGESEQLAVHMVNRSTCHKMRSCVIYFELVRSHFTIHYCAASLFIVNPQPTLAALAPTCIALHT